MSINDVSRSNGNGRAEDWTVKNKSVKFAVFAAGIDAGRQIREERFIEFTPGEAAIENLGIHADGDGAESLGVEKTDELARVALPDGKKCGHADARKVLLAINAEVFEENVAEGDFSNALVVVHAQCFLHARFVDGIDALRRDANFVERQADGLGLPLEKLAPYAVHADALVALGDGGEQGYDLDVVALENGV